MKRIPLRKASAAVICLGCSWLIGCVTEQPAQPPAVLEIADGRYAMGTVLELTLETRDADRGRRWLEIAFQQVTELEGLISRRDPKSEVSRLNATAGSGPQVVDPRVAALLVRSIEYTRLTGGSFDVSIGPLVDLWIRAADRNKLPSEGAIQEARSRVDGEGIRVFDMHAVELPNAGMSIDLGGIAKGWALDRLVEGIDRTNVSAALLSFGASSVWAVGSPAGAPGWRLALQGPAGTFAGILTLRGRALSVSSSLGQGSEIEGRRYGHVVDPATGQPLQNGVLVAVVARNAAQAEALSTALVVKSAKEGLALVKAVDGVEALWIAGNGQETASPGWKRVTRFESSAESPWVQSSISRGSSSRVRKF